MAFLNSGEGYDVYVQTKLRNSRHEEVGVMWTLRTNGHCQTEREMAEALTHDLNRMHVPWQIRNVKGEVVSQYEKSSLAVNS